MDAEQAEQKLRKQGFVLSYYSVAYSSQTLEAIGFEQYKDYGYRVMYRYRKDGGVEIATMDKDKKEYRIKVVAKHGYPVTTDKVYYRIRRGFKQRASLKEPSKAKAISALPDIPKVSNEVVV